MKQTRLRMLFVPAVLLAALTLGGCTAQSAPAAPQPATPAAEPSQSPPPSTPSDGAAATSEIVVTATAIELRDEGGALLQSYDYFQPTEDVLAGLEGAFGAEAVSTPFPAGGDQGPGVNHVWGGFTLVDTEYEGQAPHTSNHWVRVSSASEHGVRLRAVDGIAVGDDAAALESAHPDTSDRVARADGTERLDVFVGGSPLPDFEDGSNTMPLTFSVWLIAEGPDLAVTEFRAPSPNFGA